MSPHFLSTSKTWQNNQMTAKIKWSQVPERQGFPTPLLWGQLLVLVVCPSGRKGVGNKIKPKMGNILADASLFRLAPLREKANQNDSGPILLQEKVRSVTLAPSSDGRREPKIWQVDRDTDLQPQLPDSQAMNFKLASNWCSLQAPGRSKFQSSPEECTFFPGLKEFSQRIFWRKWSSWSKRYLSTEGCHTWG